MNSGRLHQRMKNASEVLVLLVVACAASTTLISLSITNAGSGMTLVSNKGSHGRRLSSLSWSSFTPTFFFLNTHHHQPAAAPTSTTTRTRPPRQCTSPEYDAQSNHSSSDQNNNNDNNNYQMDWCSADSTGSSKSSLHLQELAHALQQEYQAQCESKLIVFGAAFGKKYLDFVWVDPLLPELKRRQPQGDVNFTSSSSCHFLFVLDQTMEFLPPRRRTTTPASNSSSSNNVNGTSSSNNSSELSSSSSPLLWPDDVTLSRTGGQHIVLVKQDSLPFAHPRRNIKWLKFQPHRLFPWAQRIMWVDAKLRLDPSMRNGPKGLERYYEKTIADNGVCGSVVSLPLHPSTMTLLPFTKAEAEAANQAAAVANPAAAAKKANEPQTVQSTLARLAAILPTVRFASHCQAIREAFRYRPDVSDSLHSVLTQCEYYLKQVSGFDFVHNNNSSNATSTSSNHTINVTTTPVVEAAAATNTTTDLWQSSPLISPELDSTLIDSAVLAWDLRTDRCRDFVSQLLCNWLQEIACFSDRDQLSFGYVLHYLQQEQEHEEQQPPHHHHQTLPENKEQDGGLQLVWKHDQLQEQQQQQPPKRLPESAHRILMDSQTRQPYLFYVKSRCHWYYGKFAIFNCDYQYERNQTNSSSSSSVVAVVPTTTTTTK
ncbi:hypothetical protein ACA910_014407 [Epithemia clementina (nom. ined.)]